MGRTVIAEENVNDYISSLYGVKTWELGLIVGQTSSQRDFIVHLARTPEQVNEEREGSSTENEDKPQKKSGKQPSVEEVENNWVVEHARQVTKMLPGGLVVLGVFVFAPPEMVVKIQTKLRTLIYSIYKATLSKYIQVPDNASTERIILQICSKTKKIICRTLDVSDPKVPVKPAELKYQSFVSKWHRISCMFCVNASYIVQQKHEKSKLHSQIMTGFKPTLQSVDKAIGTINGQLLPSRQLLGGDKHQSHSKKHQNQEVQHFTVDLLLKGTPESTTPEQKHSVADIKLCGVLSSRAYLHNKATVEEAIQAVKQDIARSMVSRSELLCEDIEVVEEEKEDEPPSSTWICPKRIFAPVYNGSLFFCDYMFPEEQFQDSLERFSDLLNVRPKEEDLESMEEIPDESEDLNRIIEDIQPNHQPLNVQPQISQTNLVKSYGIQVLGMVVGFVAVAAAGMSFLIDSDSFL